MGCKALVILGLGFALASLTLVYAEPKIDYEKYTNDNNNNNNNKLTDFSWPTAYPSKWPSSWGAKPTSFPKSWLSSKAWPSTWDTKSWGAKPTSFPGGFPSGFGRHIERRPAEAKEFLGGGG